MHPSTSKILTFLLISSFITWSSGANILFFFGVSTYSHKLQAWPLVETLAERGHEITFFSPHPPKSKSYPRITEIVPEGLQQHFKKIFGSDSDYLSLRKHKGHQSAWHELLPAFALSVCDIILKNNETLTWVSSSSYDLVILDGLFNECGLGLAWKFGAPHITFGTCTTFMWQPDAHGFLPETSYVPDVSMDYPRDMTFLQRVSNTLRPVLWHLYRQYVMFPKMESMLRNSRLKGMADMPQISEIEKNTSLVLQNMHFSMDYPKAVPPLVVPIGGFHLGRNSSSLETATIPKDMQKFLNETGDEGFIYSSFGSVVQMSKMSLEMRHIFTQAFGNSSLRFLWKYEPQNGERLPVNIYSSGWMPQRSILSHPKIKAFITHGGILSLYEAVYYKVPVIVMPVFADQDYNAELVKNKGYGVVLQFDDLNQSILQNAIGEITTNKIFKEKVTQTSNLLRDRKDNPLDEAIWWIEYVLRNPNSGHSRQPLAAHQTWFQRRVLDVWLFLLVSAVILVISFIIILSFGARIIIQILNFIFIPTQSAYFVYGNGVGTVKKAGHKKTE